MEKILEGQRCYIDIIGNAIGEGDLKADYEQLREAVDAVFKNDLSKCREIDGGKEKLSYV